MYDFSKSTPLVIAHRGARGDAPENTLEAAELAHSFQADMWELDVCRTKDGRLIVFHDDMLTRTTDITKQSDYAHREPWRVCDFTLDELRSLDAGSWFVEQDPFGRIASGIVTQEQCDTYHKVRIPTLQEALTLTRDAGWTVNVEIKDLTGQEGHDTIVGEVLDLIKRLDMVDAVILSSFQHDYLRQAKKMMPDLATGALVEDNRPEDPVALCRELGVQAYHPEDSLLTDEDITALRAENIAINVWTVNDMKEAERFVRQGVQGIITDFPKDCLDMMHRQGLR